MYEIEYIDIEENDEYEEDIVAEAGVDYEDMTVYFSNYSGGGKYIVMKVERKSFLEN